MNAVSSDVAGQRVLAFVVFVALSWGAGAVGAQFAPDGWYAKLHKPLITPPDDLFRIIWPLLYTLNAIGGWLAWDRNRRVERAHALWLAQLLLTVAWPWLFFGLHQIELALAALVALLLVMLVLLAAFWRLRPLASVAMLPYFGWLLFAALLNVAFVGLN